MDGGRQQQQEEQPAEAGIKVRQRHRLYGDGAPQSLVVALHAGLIFRMACMPRCKRSAAGRCLQLGIPTHLHPLQASATFPSWTCRSAPAPTLCPSQSCCCAWCVLGRGRGGVVLMPCVPCSREAACASGARHGLPFRPPACRLVKGFTAPNM